jgi:hypothetical protein
MLVRKKYFELQVKGRRGNIQPVVQRYGGDVAQSIGLGRLGRPRRKARPQEVTRSVKLGTLLPQV